jgi:hypothetical protein
LLARTHSSFENWKKISVRGFCGKREYTAKSTDTYFFLVTKTRSHKNTWQKKNSASSPFWHFARLPQPKLCAKEQDLAFHLKPSLNGGMAKQLHLTQDRHTQEGLRNLNEHKH